MAPIAATILQTGPAGGEGGKPAPSKPVPEPIRFRLLDRVQILGQSVPVAATLASRLIGLALLRRERAAEGLLIPGCRSIHTFGMRFAIEVLFLDEEGRVIDLRREVPACRVARNPAAAAVLELPSP